MAAANLRCRLAVQCAVALLPPLALALLAASRVEAHEGPPFPVLMDEPLGGLVVSVWADPDIGEARFYIVVESPEGGPPRRLPEVSLWVEPVSGRLERAAYAASQQALRNRAQFESRPHFDQQDQWTVGIRLTDGDAPPREVTLQIESTPPGFGPWDLAIYLFPFLLIGGLWLAATIRVRRRAAAGSPAPPAAPQEERR